MKRALAAILGAFLVLAVTFPLAALQPQAVFATPPQVVPFQTTFQQVAGARWIDRAAQGLTESGGSLPPGHPCRRGLPQASGCPPLAASTGPRRHGSRSDRCLDPGRPPPLPPGQGVTMRGFTLVPAILVLTLACKAPEPKVRSQFPPDDKNAGRGREPDNHRSNSGAPG